MSYVSALTAVKDAIDAISGLTFVPDPRADTLADEGLGASDGAFALYCESSGNPWEEAVTALNPQHWWAQVRLEICTLLMTSVFVQEQTVESRARAAVEALCYGGMSANTAVIFEDEQPVRVRNYKDKRLVWSWRFKLRYTE